MLRKAQDIEVRVYGTRDHYKYAETEVSLAFLLLKRKRQEEALPLLLHAKAVLEAQVPSHPLLAQLRGLFSVVADFLEQVAGGGPLPPVPADLPQEVADFIAAVRKAAEEISVPA